MKNCPYCAEEIQDAAVVCRHCGRDLRTGATGPVTLQAQPVSQPLPVSVTVTQPKQTNWLAIVVVLVGGCLMLGCCVFFGGPLMSASLATIAARDRLTAQAGKPDTTATPKLLGSTATPGRTATPAPTTDTALGLTLTEFVNEYEDLTELQREDFLASLPGKTVDWTGKVNDVTSDGIMIDMPGSIWNGYALLKDVPADVAVTIKKDSRIHFTGTVEGTTEFLFFYLDLVNVQIIEDQAAQ